ncbi:MAG: hypothetical protein IJ660_06585 [Alphaproteobacteria bacterium]|nr:hypothetical protein [Alphaproteobacteria bacterium]
MTFLKKITSIFSHIDHAGTQPESLLVSDVKFRVTVIDFQDSIESDGGKNLSYILQSIGDFDVRFFDEPFNKTFLNLESRTLFDMIDKGQMLLERTGSDILIWGCRENNRIRLNFQTPQQYEHQKNSFTSLLDSLYLPSDLLNSPETFPQALKTLLHGVIISTINPTSSSVRIHRKYLLKKDITLLSNDTSAKQISVNYLPFIMNFLGIIYLSSTFDSEDLSDFKITQNLFNTALKHQDLIASSLHLGCIYNHLGQLNDCASQKHPRRTINFFRDAVHHYHQAQRYLGKYTYPYDYGNICYKLAHLYFNYWKQKQDLQALRDSVSQLREVEKIFTLSQFPDFWANIQKELGYLLSLLGNITHSSDILQLAINSYQNHQKIMNEKREPMLWAEAQEHIGNIHYKIATQQDNRDHLEDALECYHDALYIYENASQEAKIKQLLIAIAKVNNDLRH